MIDIAVLVPADLSDGGDARVIDGTEDSAVVEVTAPVVAVKGQLLLESPRQTVIYRCRFASGSKECADRNAESGQSYGSGIADAILHGHIALSDADSIDGDAFVCIHLILIVFFHDTVKR